MSTVDRTEDTDPAVPGWGGPASWGWWLPVVGLLLVPLGVSVALAPLALLTGRLLAQVGLALLLVLLFRPLPPAARHWPFLGVMLLGAGTLAEGGARLLARPLSFSASPIVLPLLLLPVALLLLARLRGNARPLALIPAVLAFGALAASATAVPLDTASILAGAATTILPVLGLTVLLHRFASPRRLRRGEIAALLGLVLAGLYGVVRVLAMHSITESYSSTVGIASGLLLVAATLSAGLALVSRKALSSRTAMAALAVPLSVVLIAAAAPALVALDRDAAEGMVLATDAVLADLEVAQGMTSEVGAGPRPEFRGKSFEECDKLNSRDCFITHFDDIALRYGVAASVANLLEKVQGNKGATFPSHCHQVVHNLGQMAYQLASEFRDAADLDPQVCGTGYTHGLWEQQFEILGTQVMFARTGSLCQELNMVSTWYNWTCHHILGHMMSAKLSNDPTRAAEYCSKVTDAQSITDCLTGGWMNFFQDDAVIAKMRASGTLEDLFGVCYGAPISTKFFCYQELFPAIYSMLQGDDFAAGQACLNLAEPSRGEGLPWTVDAQNYTDRCVQGLARGIGASSAQDYLLMRDRCLSMPTRAHDPCLTAVAANYVLNTGAAKTAIQICPSVTDEAYREYCYFWAKYSRMLLANGPNSQNLPAEDEVRLPESVGSSPRPGFAVLDRSDVSRPAPRK